MNHTHARVPLGVLSQSAAVARRDDKQGVAEQPAPLHAQGRHLGGSADAVIVVDPSALSRDSRTREVPGGSSRTPYDIEIGCSAHMIYDKMREEESGRLFDPSARYVKHRRLLVDWICEIVEDYHLNASTAHVAVGYLDRFLHIMEVNKNRLQLVAMAAIVIAAKYEEPEIKVPPADRMNLYAGNTYAPKMIHHMEVLMLNRLNWRLTVITPLHLLGLFHSIGVLFNDDLVSRKPIEQRVARYMQKYTSFFADLCLQEFDFQTYRPSLLAAAIVIAARRALVIRPLWNPRLEAVLQYPQESLAPVIEHIWSHYSVHFVDEAAQQDAQAAAEDAVAAASPAEDTRSAIDLLQRTPEGAVNPVSGPMFITPPAQTAAAAPQYYGSSSADLYGASRRDGGAGGAPRVLQAVAQQHTVQVADCSSSGNFSSVSSRGPLHSSGAAWSGGMGYVAPPPLAMAFSSVGTVTGGSAL